MASKDFDNSQYLSAEDSKDGNGSKLILNKFEYDLYHDEDNVVGKIIRVKRFGNSSKGEKWKIYEDTKITLIIDGDKLTKKEKMFLYTPEGINFLISQYKSGNRTISALKKNFKEKI